jgi:hypothetical protein
MWDNRINIPSFPSVYTLLEFYDSERISHVWGQAGVHGTLNFLSSLKTKSVSFFRNRGNNEKI